MDKPINIVFAYHENPNRRFLFRVPDNATIQAGDKIFVDTIHGEHPATAYTPSIWVSKAQLDAIVLAFGAYYPLKYVTGREVTKTIKESLLDDDIPF